MTSVWPTATEQARLRNLYIIVHIDHGKSILVDRTLQATGVVQSRGMHTQYLDRMDIEREYGIAIKSQTVCMPWVIGGDDGAMRAYALNMIDTPGRVDLSHEVNRSLATYEGVVLLVDAARGIQTQTLANLYMAIEEGLTIIPILNKIDPPAVESEKHAEEIASLIGCDVDDVLKVSGKTGQGVPELLDRIVETVPPLRSDPEAPARTTILDSVYDTCHGVVTYVRVVDGTLKPRERIEMLSTRAVHDLLEAGVISPEPMSSTGLGVGEVGYLTTGVKDVRRSKVGDTVISAAALADKPLSGHQDLKPTVFSGLFPVDGSDPSVLRDALDELKLDNAALTYEPETSVALDFDFRCGYLGLLHPKIIRERLEREFNLDIISIAPSVVHEVTMEDRSTYTVTNPSEFPEGKVSSVSELVVWAMILAPSEFVGMVMELCQSRRGTMQGMDYLSEPHVEMHYILPLVEIVFDFFGALKSRTRGYVSLNYEMNGSRGANLAGVDTLLSGDRVDAFSAIVHRSLVYSYGVMMTKHLKDLIPCQQFEVPVQAIIGIRVIARETIRALRKDTPARCYGGNITRKHKLLEKQKEGKKRVKVIGWVEVPQEAFIAAPGADVPIDAKPGEQRTAGTSRIEQD